MTSMRIHIPVEVIPAASGDLERLVEAGERGALPATVVDAVMAQVSSDLAPNGRVALFSREARWAAVIASAIEQVAGRRAPVAELDRARRAQIVRLIEQHSDDPRLSPETIAAALGVSRRTLYLAAEPLGGIAECLRGVRAWRAIERIEDPTDRSSLQVIARESGFTSHRRMTRAINAELGISPAALRTRVQGEAS
jgi:AraC-like DNA-binding protein